MAGKRKYDLNENYFEKIDSEKKAYWLGFILADGYIGLKRGKPAYLEITLKSSDVGHLEKFKKAVAYDGPIFLSFRDQKERARLILNSMKFVANLDRQGIYNKKSLTSEPIYFYDKSLQKSFWRGVLDGDGTIFTTYPKDRKFTNHIGLIGTKSICESFSSYCKNISSTRSNNIEKRDGCYRFLVSGNKTTREIHNHFYNGAEIYLERKRNYVV